VVGTMRGGLGLRHLPADTHLIDWLTAKGIAVDVVTDHDPYSDSSAHSRATGADSATSRENPAI
jgi:hypothetical protein